MLEKIIIVMYQSKKIKDSETVKFYIFVPRKYKWWREDFKNILNAEKVMLFAINNTIYKLKFFFINCLNIFVLNK